MTLVEVLLVLNIFNGKEISTLPTFETLKTTLQTYLGKEGKQISGIDLCLTTNSSSSSSRSSSSSNLSREAPLMLSEYSLDGYRLRFSTTDNPLQSCWVNDMHTVILYEEDLCKDYSPHIICSGGGIRDGAVNIGVVDKSDGNESNIGRKKQKLMHDGKEQERDAIQMNDNCYLYWPVNNSDILVYAPLPFSMTNEYQQSEEMLILYCLHLPDYNANFELTVTQTFGNRTRSYTMEVGEYRNSFVDNVLTLPLFYDLAVASNYIDGKRRNLNLSIILHTKDINQHVASFTLQRKIVVASHDLLEPSTVKVHPLVNSIGSRDHLGAAFSVLLPNARSMVEVGVQNGEYAKLILSQWSHCKRYVFVDPWHENASGNNDPYVDTANNDHQRRHFEAAVKNIPDFALNKTAILKHTSLQAAELLANNSVDIVYIDARHDYHSVLKDMSAWYPKVKKEGMLAGHDYLLTYSHNTIFTVKPAVDKFAREHNLIPFQTHDNFPTWMLFKP